MGGVREHTDETGREREGQEKSVREKQIQRGSIACFKTERHSSKSDYIHTILLYQVFFSISCSEVTVPVDKAKATSNHPGISNKYTVHM